MTDLAQRYADFEQNGSKTEKVYAFLRREIILLRLPPGTSLVEKEICQAFKISRTPLREALIQLETENLVDILSHAGTYVSEIKAAHIEEAIAVREVLELLGIRRAARNITEPDLDELHSLTLRMDRILKRDALDEYLEVDDQFHQTIAKASGFPNLWRLINLPKAHLDRLRQLSAPVPGHLAVVTEQHKAVLEGLAARDPERSVETLRHHLRYAVSVMRGLLKPEHFA